MENEGNLYVKLNSFIIVATFFSLWLAVQFEEDIENIFAYVFILSFGILHGANDLKLIQHSEASQLSKWRFIKVLFYYVLFVLASAFLFYFLPVLALFLFILFSGYHFGEQHWRTRIERNSIIGHSFFFVYGIFLLCLLFSAHLNTVVGIIFTITGKTILENIFLSALIFSGIAMIILYFFLAIENKKLQRSFIKEIFYLVVFFIVFNTASLLWAFAIYFVFWHSIPSLIDQVDYLFGSLTKSTIIEYIKYSFPYWLISLIGIAVILYLFKDDLETSLSFFFSFLAAITFPHVLVINRINNA